MQFSLFIFVCGCIGAMAPEIVRLYKLRYRPPEFRKSYFLISIVFSVLGGFVAVILPATTPWGAFYAGVSLPIITSASFGKPPKYVQELALGTTSLRPSPRNWKEYLGVLFTKVER
jgi:hypothetical protein